MGIVLSSANPRNDNERPRHIWDKYEWSDGQFAANIQKGLVTPCYRPTTVQNLTYAYCSVCYNGFERINELTCKCHLPVCTECLARSFPPSALEKRTCPNCRGDGWRIQPNLTRKQLMNPFVPWDSIESPVVEGWDDNLPDEINVMFMELNLKDEEREQVKEMVAQGIPCDEIIRIYVAKYQ